jgi:hypothetical protein
VDNIFIGGNRFHNNRENAVDIKSSSNVVVSGNTMYGFATSSTSGGAAVVVHYNPENVWILGNTISQSEHGIVSTGSQNLWIVSNIVFAIHHAQQVWQPERVYARGSAIHFRGTTSGGVVNNTFYEYDIGIQLARGASGYRIVNNLFVNRSRAEGYDIITTDPVVASKSTLDHLAFRLSADERIFWRNRTYTANQLRKAHPGLCKRCIVSDETLLVDPADNNFSPRRDAPIVDAGAAMDDIPGISAANSDNLAFDALGQPRRTGASVDIGAVELMQ